MMEMTKKIVVVLLCMTFAVTGCSATSLENAGKEVQDTLGDLTDSNNKYVLMVKGGHNENYPDLTYEQAFSNFFQTPRWRYFTSDDGQDVVEFTGDCTFRDASAKARMQFVVDEEEGTFQISYFALNELPQDMITWALLMSTVFGGGQDISSDAIYSEDDYNTPQAETEESFGTSADYITEKEARALIDQWFGTHPITYDYEVELCGEYETNATYECYWYNLYIGDLFYDMILVDGSTGELTIGEGRDNIPMGQWYTEIWIPYIEGEYAAEGNGQMAIEDWIKTDECEQFLEEMNAGMSDQGVSVFFEVSGNVVSMVYQYLEQIEVADNAQEAMTDLFSNNAQMFVQVREELERKTGDELILRVLYRNADYSEIFHMDF